MQSTLWMIILALCISVPSHAKLSWSSWVGKVRSEAVDRGIDPYFFDDIFRDLRPSKRVKHFDRTQPEKRLTFMKYRNTRVSKYRIALGRKEYKRHRTLLNAVANDYGVDPCFIVSLWGMESSYGRFMGNFPVIKSLATLAYDSRRADFFRKELFYALQIVNEGHVSLSQFKGEWAGASGQPQFLPSSWYRFAEDYDRDGRKDIWGSYPDIFASIANYLKGNGWQTGQPWSVLVNLPANFDMNLEGRSTEKSVRAWQALGVRLQNGGNLPYQNLTASIVKPYGGPTFLAFKNFKVIMRYNNSTYYAGSIGYMADAICRRNK